MSTWFEGTSVYYQVHLDRMRDLDQEIAAVERRLANRMGIASGLENSRNEVHLKLKEFDSKGMLPHPLVDEWRDLWSMYEDEEYPEEREERLHPKPVKKSLLDKILECIWGTSR